MGLNIDLNNSDTLVMAVTGYRNNLNLPVDDFFQYAGLQYASKIVISDPTKMKTLAGLPPEFPTFDHLLTHLESIVMEKQPKNLLVTGTSGGGHTALLLGHLLKADKVVAFAPYPYLSIKEGKRLKDPGLRSWLKLAEKFDKLPEESRQYLDLHNVLSKWNQKTEYFVHVSRYHEMDYKRALYLSGLPNVNIVSHPYHQHAIASVLSKDSQLNKCFLFPYQHKNICEKI